MTGSTTGSRFAGKVALVTGGASGIGAATVRGFVREGASVVALDADAAALDELAGDAELPASRVRGVVGDVRLADDCRRAVETAVADFGGLDVAFCNAGVYEGGTVETQSVAAWEHQVDVMLRGTFLTCKYAVGALRQRGGGAIVLSGSNCSHIGCAGRFAYTAAKAAMPVLAKQLSNDYYHSAGIRVNCVSPGYVRTRMTEAIWRRQTRAAADASPPSEVVSTWQTPEAIAAAVLFLASDEARDVTGVTVPVSRTALLRVAAPRFA